MLLQDEVYIVKWLSQYGALPKSQLMNMLQKPKNTAEKIIKNLKRDGRIADVGGGYYIGLDTLCRPDQRTIIAVWVLLKFIESVEPMAHYPAVYPSQLFFLKENTGYEIVVLYEGEESLLKLLQPSEDLKYIIVLRIVGRYRQCAQNAFDQRQVESCKFHNDSLLGLYERVLRDLQRTSKRSGGIGIERRIIRNYG